MDDFRIPGFTADASVYVSCKCYSRREHHAGIAAQPFIPAIKGRAVVAPLPSPRRCTTVYDDEGTPWSLCCDETGCRSPVIYVY